MSRWKKVPATELFKVGDRVIHYEELRGTKYDDGSREVRGFVEYGEVVSVKKLPDFPGIQDVVFKLDGLRGSRLRYYNSSLVKDHSPKKAARK